MTPKTSVQQLEPAICDLSFKYPKINQHNQIKEHKNLKLILQ